jgi:dual-specificity kinase/CDC-like kinase
MTKETANRHQCNVEHNKQSRRRSRRKTKDLDKVEDDARKHDFELDRQGISSNGTNRRKQRRQRQPPHSPERQRKRMTGNSEERGNLLKRLSYCSTSSASSGTSRWLLKSADVANRNEDLLRDRDRRCSKQSQPSKRRSVRSGSFHDDSTGHYRIRIGEIIGHRYKIMKEAGLGTFGRVVQCLHIPDRNQDRGHRSSRETDRHVAIKIVRNVKRYYESAVIEARIISEANRRGGRGRTHCVLLLDTFRIDGHFCLVFENLGPSLYDFLKRNNYQPFPMLCVQDFTVQLLETLEFLHGIRMIHTDLKIENVLLINDREVTYRNQRVPASTKIKIIDFGGACYDSDKKSSVINTRQYRAPEVSFSTVNRLFHHIYSCFAIFISLKVILGTGWSMPSDM